MDTNIVINGMPLSRHIAATILVDVLDVKETGEKYYALEDKVTDAIESILRDVSDVGGNSYEDVQV